jgi:Tol biopolymer transport system component
VSASDLGASGSGESSAPAISSDGRYVAFVSDAADLVADDNNLMSDVFVYDRLSGQISMVSLSATGRAASGSSRAPSLSSSGRFIAFSSTASDLVLGDANNAEDVFVRDMQTGVTVRVSIGRSGENAQGESIDPVISANGRYVAFASTASNIANNDSNEASDVFVRDMQLGISSMISVTSSGGSGAGASDQPAMSADAQIVAFRTTAPDISAGAGVIAQVVVVDRTSQKTVTASGASGGGDGASWLPAVSANGRRVAFVSAASNLVSGDTNGTSDVFRFELASNKLSRLSARAKGAQSTGICSEVALAANDEYAAFVSSADDLVSGDDNGSDDVFVVPLD